jgi:UDPglucose 6-dehydrogenase
MNNHKPIIGFAGLTHLGINSLAATAERGFQVIGYHENQDTITELKNGINKIIEPSLSELLIKNSSKITYTSSIEDLNKCDIVYIAVDVPTDDKGISDLSVINKIVIDVIEFLNKDAILVILCQVPPSYTRNLSWPKDKLFYQVETLIFGRAVDRALNPERFIIGCENPKTTLPENFDEYLKSFNCPILQMKFESAELAKIAINMFLISSVSTTNMLAEICEEIGASWSEISPALKLDKRIGQFAYLSPGLGISGGNLERDMASILAISKDRDTDAKIINTWQNNSEYRKNWVLKILENFVFNTNESPKIGILGLTYKENTHSIKNSPSIALIDKIKHLKINAFDPAVPKISQKNVNQVNNMYEALEDADVVAIMTPWNEFRELQLKDFQNKFKGKVVIDPYGILRLLNLQDNTYKYFTLGENIKC